MRYLVSFAGLLGLSLLAFVADSARAATGFTTLNYTGSLQANSQTWKDPFEIGHYQCYYPFPDLGDGTRIMAIMLRQRIRVR